MARAHDGSDTQLPRFLIAERVDPHTKSGVDGAPPNAGGAAPGRDKDIHPKIAQALADYDVLMQTLRELNALRVARAARGKPGAESEPPLTLQDLVHFERIRRSVMDEERRAVQTRAALRFIAVVFTAFLLGILFIAWRAR